MADIDVINVGGVDYNIKDTTARNAISSQVVPVNHRSTATTYGHGTSEYFGHVKVSDNYWELQGYNGVGIAASQGGVYDMYTDHVAHYSRSPEASNLNNLCRAGIYSYSNASNKPSSNWGDVIVGGVADNTYNSFITQLAVPYSNGDAIATRYFNSDNGQWSAWQKYVASIRQTGTATLNTTYTAGSGAGVYWYRNGNAVMVNIHVFLKGMTTKEGEYPIASGLPNSIWKIEDFMGLWDSTNNKIVPLKIRTDGVLCAHPKQVLPSENYWYDGSITYVCE